MHYLTMYTIYFIYSYMVSYIMVKDHSDNERGNQLQPLLGLNFLDILKNVLYISEKKKKLKNIYFITK